MPSLFRVLRQSFRDDSLFFLFVHHVATLPEQTQFVNTACKFREAKPKMAFVQDILPTAREIRAKEKAEQRARAQAEYEERYEARRLLFGIGEGKAKNLTPKQRAFCIAVIRKSYHGYLHDLAVGFSRWNKSETGHMQGKKWRKKLNPNRGKDHTLTFFEYRKIWWKGNKAVYRRRDCPKMVKQKFEEMQRGERAPMPQ